MKKKEAIRLIQQQVDRLSKQNPTDDWVVETATYLKAIFGEGSEQHRTALKWRGPRLFPSTVTKEQLRQHSIDERHTINLFLTSCISAVRTGIMHKPERKNLLSDATNVQIIGFTLSLIIASSGLGYWAGTLRVSSPAVVSGELSDPEASRESNGANDGREKQEVYDPTLGDSSGVAIPAKPK